MHSQYGPGGQFDPDWRPTTGPLGPQPPPPPGGDVPPPPPEEPPAPAKPAWRTVQARQPRRQRTRRGEQPTPAQTLAPEEPQQERQSSWATWQRELLMFAELL